MYSSAGALQLRGSKQRWGDVCRPVADPPSSKKKQMREKNREKTRENVTCWSAPMFLARPNSIFIEGYCQGSHRNICAEKLSCGDISDFYAWHMWRNLNILHMRRNFKFLRMIDLEKSDISFHVGIFQMSPHGRCGEIWHLGKHKAGWWWWSSAYILKATKSAKSAFQSQQICGKSAWIKTTKFCDEVRSKVYEMHHLKAKCQKIWNQEHVDMRFGALVLDFSATLGLYFIKHIAELTVFRYSDWQFSRSQTIPLRKILIYLRIPESTESRF